MTRARKTGGRVTFVGTGTGDAGLLTVRATEALAAAEVAFADAGVPDSIRALIGGEIRAFFNELCCYLRPGRPVIRMQSSGNHGHQDETE